MKSRASRQYEAVVLQQIRYGDSSIIVKVYSRSDGVMSFIARSARKPDKGITGALFQPLTQIEFVAAPAANNEGLAILREARLIQSATVSGGDVLKGCIVLFLAEVLLSTIRQHEADEELYNFIIETIDKLRQCNDCEINDFPLLFLVQLSDILGFGPTDDYSTDRTVFWLQEGRFSRFAPGNEAFVDSKEGENFSQMLKAARTGSGLNISGASRRYLLRQLLSYFAFHHQGMTTIKSHEVLHMVLM